MTSLKLYLLGRAKSFQNAFHGLVYVIKTQKNAQIHLLATCIVVAVGFICHLSTVEFSIVLFCIAIVWITETINTSIETVVDLCTPNYHPLAKVGKDVSAAAVLISALAATLIGFIIFLPHLFT